ncbi:hypothetical protein Gogos_011667 [Gossypium gossypioides]|uniref:Uncharacterized protein n=1 Tax=Gossypium gossypioides TaxID=34282 RepID=A0A7J9BQ32_GOSGO|nr:hypothetical protein [Gossypium gossypioides]
MRRLVVGTMTTPGYNEWWVRRINDNTPKPSPKNSQSIEEHLRVVPSELEIIRQDFERKNSDLEKKIKQMEEEKMNLILDIDVQKLETEKLRKGKNKVEEDLDSLKTDYKNNQVRNRDYIMEEAVVQIRGVADHLQTLAVQADTLSVKYELESDRGQELAALLRKIKVLSIRAKPYL